jgi:HEAT repeat protein
MDRAWVARLLPAAAFQFCFIAAVAMLKPGVNALTLSRFQASALPVLYLAAALVAGALAVLGGHGTRRRHPGGLLGVGAAVSALLLAGVWLDLPLVAPAGYLFVEVFTTQVSLAFWGAMGDAFDAREARRAFSWVNGLGMSGAIAGGFLAQVLARTSGALALLGGGACFLALGAAAWRFHQPSSEVRSAATAEPRRATLREVLSGPYTQLLGVLVLGLSMLQHLTDFVFRARAAGSLVEADMADVFAAHQLWTGVFCVIFQLALAEVLLRKLGILRYAALVPATLGVLATVAWVVPSVWSAWALKVFDAAASWSLMPVAIQLLYAPLPDGERDATRRTIDGVVRKVGMGLAGVVLFGVANAVGLQGVFTLVLVLCALVAWALWRIRPRYIEAVHQRVAGYELDGVFDGEERLLAEALASASPDRALRAAALLERTGLLKESHVRVMLGHPHERVQERGVRLAGALGLKGLERLLEQLIVNATRRPRDAAVWMLAQLAPERARVVLPRLVVLNDIGLATAALGGLLSLPGFRDPTAEALLRSLLEKGADAPAAERREVCRLLGRLADPSLARWLKGYLDDADSSVRRLAIEAAGEGGYLELAPRLLRFLSWRDDRRVAREALARMGDGVVPLLAATLDDRSRALSLRLQLPRVLRRIGTQAAFDALLASRALDEPVLHYRVGVALGQLKADAPGLTVDQRLLQAALERRRDAARALVEPYRDARAALGESALLSRLLGDRLDQAMEVSFLLLGLRHDAHALRRAHAQLLGTDARRRAWALELVDNLLSADERELVAQHLDAHHRSLPWGAAARLPAQLTQLVVSDDSVVRAVARELARERGLWPRQRKEDDMNEVTVRQLFALEGVEIFAQSDVDDLAAVAAVAKEQRYTKGARIYAEGDPGDALYVIVEGRVEARREGEVVFTMKEKESFGETSLFDGAPRVNEVVATTDVRLLVIDRRDFLDLLADRPELLAGMFRVLSRQLKSMVVEVVNRRSTTGELPAVGAPPVRR